MECDPLVGRGGWYSTLRPGRLALSRPAIVYLVIVPDVGAFVAEEDGDVHALPADARGWEWHGPFATPSAARSVDVRTDAPVPPVFAE
jgi:hypothetical protein